MKKKSFILSLLLVVGLVQAADELWLAPHVNAWQNCLIMMVVTFPIYYVLYFKLARKQGESHHYFKLARKQGESHHSDNSKE